MLTQPRNLRTGTPIWDGYTIPRIKTQTLTHPLKTDILVIGAGISGAMVAQSLAQQGFDVVVIDRRKPLAGSTAASTALLQYEIDTPLIHLIDKIGFQKATAIWRRSKLGVESLACKIRELGLACDFERRDTLYLNGNVLNARELERECAARNAIGLRSEMLHTKDLRDRYGVKAQAAIHSWDNLICNPVCLAAGFLKEAIKHGTQIYAPVTGDDLVETRQGVSVITESGHTITAKHVVFATGYEIPKYIKTRKHKITSTWAMATKPVHKSIVSHLPIIWEAADPYLYLRVTADNRIVCGGEDEGVSDAVKRDAVLARKVAALTRKLHNRLPDLEFTVDYAWDGAFGTSTTGTPSIGTIPGFTRVHAVMGYGGNGITFSAIAAEIITAKIAGYTDPDADLFAF